MLSRVRGPAGLQLQLPKLGRIQRAAAAEPVGDERSSKSLQRRQRVAQGHVVEKGRHTL